MRTDEVGAAIRAEIRGCGRPYAAELRRRAASYAESRRALGSSVDVVARELGLARATLRSWVGRAVFVPVEVESDGDPVSDRIVIMDQRGGTRIECSKAETAIAIVKGLR